MRKLKLMLDRDFLNKIYISFVRPNLEYVNIVWDNCTLYVETNAIERIQIEAARIVTGATNLVSLDMLSKVTSWESYETFKTLGLYLQEHSYITNLFYRHALENGMKILLIFEIQPLSQVLNNSLTKQH